MIAVFVVGNRVCPSLAIHVRRAYRPRARHLDYRAA